MLIGIDASRSVIARRTGTEVYSLYAIRELLRMGSEHRFRLYFNGAPEPDLFPLGCERRVIPFLRLWTHLRLSAEMLVDPPDVLWVPSHVLPLVHPRKSVVTVHDLGHRYHPQAHTPGQRRYLEWSTRYHVRSAAHLVADSASTRDDLLRLYGADPDRITVAHLGVDPRLCPVDDPAQIARVRAKYGISSQYVLYVGTIQPRKNIERLIEAFVALETGGGVPDHVLVLAGMAGWYYDRIVQRIETCGVGERVVLTGYVDEGDLPALYSGASLFVMPSLYEGFCMPVLEAMVCGTPVVSSRASSLPEVVGDAALLFDPGDVGAIADAISRGIDDKGLRASLIARGQDRAKHFTWKRCARQVLEVLEQVAQF